MLLIYKRVAVYDNNFYRVIVCL